MHPWPSGLTGAHNLGEQEAPSGLLFVRAEAQFVMQLQRVPLRKCGRSFSQCPRFQQQGPRSGIARGGQNRFNRFKFRLVFRPHRSPRQVQHASQSAAHLRIVPLGNCHPNQGERGHGLITRVTFQARDKPALIQVVSNGPTRIGHPCRHELRSQRDMLKDRGRKIQGLEKI